MKWEEIATSEKILQPEKLQTKSLFLRDDLKFMGFLPKFNGNIFLMWIKLQSSIKQLQTKIRKRQQ